MRTSFVDWNSRNPIPGRSSESWGIYSFTTTLMVPLCKRFRTSFLFQPVNHYEVAFLSIGSKHFVINTPWSASWKEKYEKLFCIYRMKAWYVAKGIYCMVHLENIEGLLFTIPCLGYVNTFLIMIELVALNGSRHSQFAFALIFSFQFKPKIICPFISFDRKPMNRIYDLCI